MRVALLLFTVIFFSSDAFEVSVGTTDPISCFFDLNPIFDTFHSRRTSNSNYANVSSFTQAASLADQLNCSILHIHVFSGNWSSETFSPTSPTTLIEISNATLQTTVTMESLTLSTPTSVVLFDGIIFHGNIFYETLITDDHFTMTNCVLDGDIDVKSAHHAEFQNSHFQGLVNVTTGDVLIQESSFFDSTVHLNAGNITIQDSIFEQLQSPVNLTSQLMVSILNTTFMDNNCELVGAVSIISSPSASLVSIADCIFRNNQVTNPLAPAIFIQNANFIYLTENIFSCNGEHQPPVTIMDSEIITIDKNYVDPQCPTACNVGEFSLGGIMQCDNCSMGFYSNSTTAQTCTPCPPGSHAPTTGLSECVACAEGTHSDKNATSCSPNDPNPCGLWFEGDDCNKLSGGSYGVIIGGASLFIIIIVVVSLVLRNRKPDGDDNRGIYTPLTPDDA